MQDKESDSSPALQLNEVRAPIPTTSEAERLSPQENPNRPPKPGQAKTPVTIRSEQYSFCGPLPPPGLLADYERVTPGLADRIVAMAESESAHRRGMEEKIVSKSFSEARLGQIFALAICLATIGVGSYTALQGKEWAGIAIGISGVSGIVTTFIMGRTGAGRSSGGESNQKSENTSANEKQRGRRKK